MAVNKFYDLQKGSKVGVIKHGSWGNTSQQGVYTVTKCNGTVCEITRDSDGYVRSFSNRTGIEKNSYSDRYNTAQLISLSLVRQRIWLVTTATCSTIVCKMVVGL